MDKDNEKAKSFTRRALFVGALQGGALTVLAGRLAWLQIAEGQRYKTLADNNRINIRIVPPSRGQIVDRSGVPFAVNEQNFRVVVIPEQTDDLGKALSRLQKIVSLSQRDIQKILRKAAKSASFVPIEVKENLTWEEVAAVEVNLPDLPGLFIDVGEIRHYPMGEATAHLVGYVGAVSKAELNDDPLLALPGFKIGKTGIEKFYDRSLRGTAGTAQVEVNVMGREVRELKRSPGIEGKPVKLTIDSELQAFLQRRLAAERSASGVVMDVHTGAVYALSSSPAFDPNMFTQGIPAEKWEELLADPGLPLNNKAVSGLYPPGSTFKMITALAGLESGAITRNTTAYCPGHYDFGDNRFHCWKRGGHGTVDLTAALAQSCDTFFYEAATAIGIDKIAETARRMGLGEKYGFELAEERAGLVPTKDWKFGQMGKTWQPGETIVASIGQGYIQATPLQLAVMTARLVNGGNAVKPYLTGYVGADAVAEKHGVPLGIKKEHLDFIAKGMNAVVNSQRGTAAGARIADETMLMGGKTGTAQVQRITMKQRLEGVKNEDLPWLSRHHALFVGYAPVASPRYACSIVVEHGSSGSATAAPIARDVLQMAQLRDPAKMTMTPGESAGLAAPAAQSGKG